MTPREEDEQNEAIKAEAMPLAERLRDLLKAMTDSGKRHDVFDVLSSKFCMRCGSLDAHDCWCDYETPLD